MLCSATYFTCCFQNSSILAPLPPSSLSFARHDKLSIRKVSMSISAPESGFFEVYDVAISSPVDESVSLNVRVDKSHPLSVVTLPKWGTEYQFAAYTVSSHGIHSVSATIATFQTRKNTFQHLLKCVHSSHSIFKTRKNLFWECYWWGFFFFFSTHYRFSKSYCRYDFDQTWHVLSYSYGGSVVPNLCA